MDTKVINRDIKVKNTIKNLILIALVIGLAIGPLFMAKNAEFAGADVRAQNAITEIDKNYEPWFSPIFEPKSGEVETFFFALQAAIGAGIVGYGLGYLRGRKKKEEETKQ